MVAIRLAVGGHGEAGGVGLRRRRPALLLLLLLLLLLERLLQLQLLLQLRLHLLRLRLLRPHLLAGRPGVLALHGQRTTTSLVVV